jgi:hypothetical protein
MLENGTSFPNAREIRKRCDVRVQMESKRPARIPVDLENAVSAGAVDVQTKERRTARESVRIAFM